MTYLSREFYNTINMNKKKRTFHYLISDIRVFGSERNNLLPVWGARKYGSTVMTVVCIVPAYYTLHKIMAQYMRICITGDIAS